MTRRINILGWLTALFAGAVKGQSLDMPTPQCEDNHGTTPCDNRPIIGIHNGRFVLADPSPAPLQPVHPLGWMTGKRTPNQCPVCGTIAQIPSTDKELQGKMGEGSHEVGFTWKMAMPCERCGCMFEH